MVVKNEAFISIEETIAKVIGPTVQSIARDAHAELSALIEKQEYALASAKAREFSLMGAADKHWSKIRELGVHALVFGQQQLVPSNMTALVRGTQKVPPELDMGLRQLVTMVERDLAEQLRVEFIRMVGNADLEDEKTPLAKADFTIKAGDLVADVAQKGVQVRANLITSRLATFGFLAQAQEINVTTYQINEILDSRICPVCQTMHGKTFSVSREISRVQNALMANDPQELKGIAPWPSQKKADVETLRAMTEEELQAAGYGSPPFHPGCRGIVVKTGTVTMMIPITPKKPVETPKPAAPTPPAPAVILAEKIDALPEHPTIPGAVQNPLPKAPASINGKVAQNVDVIFDSRIAPELLPKQEVKISDLFTAQDALDPELLHALAEAPDTVLGLPLVVKVNGLLYVDDGNHRTAMAILKGLTTLEAYVLDLDAI